jgi:hypothetical protein
MLNQCEWGSKRLRTHSARVVPRPSGGVALALPDAEVCHGKFPSRLSSAPAYTAARIRRMRLLAPVAPRTLVRRLGRSLGHVLRHHIESGTEGAGDVSEFDVLAKHVHAR